MKPATRITIGILVIGLIVAGVVWWTLAEKSAVKKEATSPDGKYRCVVFENGSLISGRTSTAVVLYQQSASGGWDEMARAEQMEADTKYTPGVPVEPTDREYEIVWHVVAAPKAVSITVNSVLPGGWRRKLMARELP